MTAPRKRILTGDRPTGPLHIGHYVGSLKNRVALQHEYETYVLIADVQALTDNFERPETLAANVREVTLDYLAVGIDPETATIALQSMIPEIHELAIYFLNLVSLGRLVKNPTVKTEIEQRGFGRAAKDATGRADEELGVAGNVPVGFLCYPLHQVADITVFGAHLVPVGADQKPMIELAREVARRFNRLYAGRGASILVEPQGLYGDVARLPGIDGQAKMSKSLGNAIYLKDDADTVRKKIRRMYTDPNRLHADTPGTVEGNPVFIYHDAFNPDRAQVDELKERYRRGAVRDVEVKDLLAEVMNRFLDPIRERRAAYEADLARVDAIIQEGTARARAVARQTMERVRAAMKINYFAAP